MPRRVVLLGALLLLIVPVGTEGRAQVEGLPTTLQWEHVREVEGERIRRGETLSTRLPPMSENSTSSLRVGRAFVGSTIGVGVGSGLGLLLLKGAAQADDRDDGQGRWREDPESEAAGILFVAGLTAMIAGGPIGAVEGGGIEQGRRDAYVGAGFGELVVGILGYALAGQLHDSTSSRLAGLGTGMAVGAATGALWITSAQEEKDGMFSYRKGGWQVSAPDVRVQPGLTTDRGPSVGVALVSIDL